MKRVTFLASVCMVGVGLSVGLIPSQALCKAQYSTVHDNPIQSMADKVRHLGVEVLSVSGDVAHVLFNGVTWSLDLVTGAITHPKQAIKKVPEEIAKIPHNLESAARELQKHHQERKTAEGF